MYISKYNLFFNVNQKGREDEKIIYNSVSSSVIIINKKAAESLQKSICEQANVKIDPQLIRLLKKYKFIYNSREEEDTIIKNAREKYRERLDKGGFQIDLVTTYYCNFKCSYCFQDAVHIPRNPDVMNIEMFEEVDEVVNILLHKKYKQPFAYYIIYGGEPLLPGRKYKGLNEIIANKCRTFSTPLAIVSNGYYLSEYCDVFKNCVIGEIQVTVDGPEEIHNKRRRTSNGKGSFKKIMDGIKKAIDYKYPINFKTVIDKDNITYIPELAEILNKNGWLDLPEDKFKIQIAENIGLYTTSREDIKHKYMAPEDILKQLVPMVKDNPSMKKYFRPQCFGIRCLLMNGAPPYPRFTRCTAGKTELAFSLDGFIYPCLAFAGFKDYSIGKYYPEMEIDEDLLLEWKNQDVDSEKKCEECLYKYICGGMCKPLISPDGLNMPPCPNVEEIMQIGFDYYLPEIEKEWLTENMVMVE